MKHGCGAKLHSAMDRRLGRQHLRLISLSSRSQQSPPAVRAKNFRNVPTATEEVESTDVILITRAGDVHYSLKKRPRSRMRLETALRELLGQAKQLSSGRGFGHSMFKNIATAVFHSNRYTAQSACEHCAGIIRHERWCITVDHMIHYAYEIVTDPSKLTIGDSLILHSLGVIWGANACQRSCKSLEPALP
jgi:hypothetical protein